MQVKFYATLRQIVGSKSVDFLLEEGMTFRELLEVILERFPALRRELLDEQSQLYGHVHLIVNGRDIRFLEGFMDTPVGPDDVVSLFPAVGGG